MLCYGSYCSVFLNEVLFFLLDAPFFFFFFLKVIDNDRGVHMRPMPGMVGLISSSSKVFTNK